MSENGYTTKQEIKECPTPKEHFERKKFDDRKRMHLGMSLKMASRNLWMHRTRSAVTILGVIIGVASIIFLVSLGYGLEKLVTDQVSNFEAFTIIDVPAANIKTLKIDKTVEEKIQKLGHITEVGVVDNMAGRIKKQDKSSSTETVISGADSNYWALSSMNVSSGSLPKAADEITINKALLTLLGEDENKIIGQKVNLDLLVPPELLGTSDSDVVTKENVPFKVVGITPDTQAPIAYVSFDALSTQGVVNFSSLKVKLDNRNNVEAVRKQLENIGLSTEYVGDTVAEIARVFSLFRIILGAFGLIALIVAALGTFNTLTVSLLERTKEVGLLKALGMGKRDVYRIFITEALIIGAIGGILGLLLGIAIGDALNIIIVFMAQKSHSDSVQLFLTPWLFASAVAVFSLIVGLITGWYPAHRAVKLNPLDALRYE